MTHTINCDECGHEMDIKQSLFKQISKEVNSDLESQKRAFEEEKKALRKLELDSSLTINDLKNRYKVLVKKYHPDVNGGNKNLEETLKQINTSYRLLLKKLSLP